MKHGQQNTIDEQVKLNNVLQRVDNIYARLGIVQGDKIYNSIVKMNLCPLY